MPAWTATVCIGVGQTMSTSADSLIHFLLNLCYTSATGARKTCGHWALSNFLTACHCSFYETLLKGGNSVFVWDNFQWWINIFWCASEYFGQQDSVCVTESKQTTVCLLMVMKEHVTQCNSGYKVSFKLFLRTKIEPEHVHRGSFYIKTLALGWV